MIIGFEELLNLQIGFGREGVLSHPDFTDAGAEHGLARFAGWRRDHDKLNGGLAGAGR